PTPPLHRPPSPPQSGQPPRGLPRACATGRVQASPDGPRRGVGGLRPPGTSQQKDRSGHPACLTAVVGDDRTGRGQQAGGSPASSLGALPVETLGAGWGRGT